MISAQFAQVLRSGREHFNARFAVARHADPNLDPESFMQFLGDVVDPLIQAVDAACPNQTAAFATQAYEVALELAALRLIGRLARYPAVEAAWRRLLAPAAHLIAANPRRALAAVSNAAHQLAVTGEARGDEWLATMVELAPQCDDLDIWLKVGQVAAWRDGIAHYRVSALRVADTLPESLALAALAAPPSASWPEVRTELRSNPWHDPAHPNPTTLRVARQAGGFRGLGGEFAAPPRVAPHGDHFLAASGDDCWLLIADAFGATLHRATDEERGPLHPRILPTGGVRAAGTRVAAVEGEIDLSGFGRITSVASNPTTIAITAQLTYSVVLIARPGQQR